MSRYDSIKHAALSSSVKDSPTVFSSDVLELRDLPRPISLSQRLSNGCHSPDLPPH
ncbi:TPA_asm: hypothetical protein HUJ06_000181 [Nelumbo nucifera]|nr:TPA_asm: hypothetical protein HUJ06_017158 [Nelumbo nucifera]DAD47227.1 TPA_asm: hypothetical protein HUJ06_017164 [Nelumbo nucifera]DAD49781.1 TPA_asm: hypothetical protein HUJ06_000181 [Nelumbo nucifera]